MCSVLKYACKAGHPANHQANVLTHSNSCAVYVKCWKSAGKTSYKQRCFKENETGKSSFHKQHCDAETGICWTCLGGSCGSSEPISEVSSFEYLGARFNSKALCDEEIKTRLALAHERMWKLDPLRRSRTISPPLKTRLIQTLVWPIVTYGAEPCTLTKDLRCNIEAFEMQCYQRSMKISYRYHVTNETVLDQSWSEKETAPNSEESQTEVHVMPSLAWKIHRAGHDARPQKTGRPT